MTRPVRLAVALVSLLLAAASCHGSPPAGVPAGGGVPAGADGDALAAGPRVGFSVAEPPLSLTASDGTALRLATLRADAVVDGPLAFTEVHLTFQNPIERTLEGTFRITLPQAASLGRFAMKIDEEWQEGEVVELEAARRAYEDFLHRKQDPALMEKSAGNEFSARVFPIPARGTKEIVVSWVEELDGPYVFALRGLPELDALDVGARLAGAAQALPRLSVRGQAPSADYVVPASALAKAGTKPVSVRSGDAAIVRVRPQATSKPDPLADAIVLVDTSASRVLGFEAEIDLVGRIVRRVAENNPNGRVSVACFDQAVAPVFDGRASAFGGEALAKIRQRGALGASDLERALGWASEAARTSKAKRVVLVTDGVATAGTTEGKKLLEKVSSLRASGVERIDAVAVGGIRDDAGLTRLVRGNLSRDGVVARAAADPSEVLRRLSEATVSGIAVRVEGATWSWPSKLDGVQAGDTYSIYAEVPAVKELRVSVDGKSEPVDPRKSDRPLVERVVAQAKVSSMLERDATGAVTGALRDDLKKSIVALATRHRIMTPYTAMLVLESDGDYQRYGIDRRSLADVLAIEDGAVRRLHRTKVKLPLADPAFVANESFAEDAKADRGGDAPDDARKKSASPPGTSAQAGQPVAGKAAAAPMVAATSTASPRSEAPPVAAPPPPPPSPKPSAPRAEASVSRVRDGVEGAPVPRAVRPARPRQEAEAVLRSALSQSEAQERSDNDDDGPKDMGQPPYVGTFGAVMDRLREGRPADALASARAWQAESPGDVLALTALGEAAEANGMSELASRAYGSVLDLFPNRADLRRFAGERLERLSAKDPAALDLAIDSFEKALADRPDHPSSHRLLTFALLRKKLYAKAFDAAVAGSRRAYEVDRFAGVDQILREDIGLVGAAWARAEPSRREEILRRVHATGGTVEDWPSLRFVLNWETDANDVDFHIHDAKGGHAFFSRKHLRSGGDLYADVTTGYGPECFTIRAPKAGRAGPYKLEAHYYSRGPMGYGMGKLEIVEHDGNGGITFEERPFVVMVDQAFVDLGTVR